MKIKIILIALMSYTMAPGVSKPKQDTALIQLQDSKAKTLEALSNPTSFTVEHVKHLPEILQEDETKIADIQKVLNYLHQAYPDKNTDIENAMYKLPYEIKTKLQFPYDMRQDETILSALDHPETFTAEHVPLLKRFVESNPDGIKKIQNLLNYMYKQSTDSTVQFSIMNALPKTIRDKLTFPYQMQMSNDARNMLYALTVPSQFTMKHAKDSSNLIKIMDENPTLIQNVISYLYENGDPDNIERELIGILRDHPREKKLKWSFILEDEDTISSMQSNHMEAYNKFKNSESVAAINLPTEARFMQRIIYRPKPEYLPTLQAYLQFLKTMGTDMSHLDFAILIAYRNEIERIIKSMEDSPVNFK